MVDWCTLCVHYPSFASTHTRFFHLVHEKCEPIRSAAHTQKKKQSHTRAFSTENHAKNENPLVRQRDWNWPKERQQHVDTFSSSLSPIRTRIRIIERWVWCGKRLSQRIKIFKQSFIGKMIVYAIFWSTPTAHISQHRRCRRFLVVNLMCVFFLLAPLPLTRLPHHSVVLQQILHTRRYWPFETDTVYTDCTSFSSINITHHITSQMYVLCVHNSDNILNLSGQSAKRAPRLRIGSLSTAFGCFFFFSSLPHLTVWHFISSQLTRRMRKLQKYSKWIEKNTVALWKRMKK